MTERRKKLCGEFRERREANQKDANDNEAN